MADTRRKDANWTICSANAQTVSFEGAQLAVLMDLRDELKLIREAVRSMNNLLQCPNFISIPGTLRQIEKKLPAKKKRAVKR